MNELADSIRRIAEEKGIPLVQLAQRAKMSQPTLHSIINKNDAKLSQLKSIAAALDVSLDRLLGVRGSDDYFSIRVRLAPDPDPETTTRLKTKIPFDITFESESREKTFAAYQQYTIQAQKISIELLTEKVKRLEEELKNMSFRVDRSSDRA